MLLFVSQPVVANWVLVSDDNEGNKYYIDFSSVKIKNNIVSALLYQDFSIKDESGDLSSRNLTEYDCKNKVFRILLIEGFKESGLKGKKTSPYRITEDWRKSIPDSIAAATFEPWCEK